MDEIVFETKELCFNSTIHYNNVQIQNNKVTFIMGESGSGKSTLLRLFNCTLTQSNGTVFYRGANISEMDTIQLRKEVSLISQSVFLFDTSIRENFIQFYQHRDEPLPSDDKINDFLNICCVTFPLDKDCTTMSGGERHRVYTAIFLSFLPKVIMLDEPTSALDSQKSNDVIRNIISFCKDKYITVIVVSHDNEIAQKFADHVITIETESCK